MEAGGSSSPNPLGRSIGLVLGKKNLRAVHKDFILFT
jgi:hypothetical protein